MPGMFDDILGPDKEEEEFIELDLNEMEFEELEMEFEEAIMEKIQEIEKSKSNSWKPKRVLS